MNVAGALQGALSRVKSINSGSLAYTGSDGTTYTASVFKSFLTNRSRELRSEGDRYADSIDDLYVLATPSDVSGWNLLPMTSEVSLDGTAYKVGNTTTTTSGFVTIWLRSKI